MEILDCTLRDGGYANNWHFSIEFARECCKAVSLAGSDYVEIGLVGTEEEFPPSEYGLFRRITPSIAKTLRDITGNRLSVLVDYGKTNIQLVDDLSGIVSLIRVATHKKDVYKAAEWCNYFEDMGFKTALQMMNFPSYTREEIESFVRFALHLKNLSANYIYVADSYGSMYPRDVALAMEYLSFLQLRFKIGFHPHNNLQLAFANTIEAINCGYDIIDGTVMGLGRGSGNLPLELLLLYLEKHGNTVVTPEHVMMFAENHVRPLMHSLDFGYNVRHAAAGHYGCHPDYVKVLIYKDLPSICAFFEKLSKSGITNYNEEHIRSWFEKDKL